MTSENAVKLDLEEYVSKGGKVSYPFPVEDFANRLFGLDIQYDDFNNLFESQIYNVNELYGCLFGPDTNKYELRNTIFINSAREPFKLANIEVDRDYYWDFAERQTIAHEIGHYSDKYVRKMESQPTLFKQNVFADNPTSIIVYPENQEIFANKYARNLLMPESEVMKLIHKNNLTGTFDLRAAINLFTEKFQVTQFMIEIRLNELNVHFLNGIYIKKFNRFKGKKYSCKDLLTLIELAKKYSLNNPYYDADNFAKSYNMLTNQTRAGGALAMTLWRVMAGKYDRKYPEVFEKRIVELANFDIDSFEKLKTKKIETGLNINSDQILKSQYDFN